MNANTCSSSIYAEIKPRFHKWKMKFEIWKRFAATAAAAEPNKNFARTGIFSFNIYYSTRCICVLLHCDCFCFYVVSPVIAWAKWVMRENVRGEERHAFGSMLDRLINDTEMQRGARSMYCATISRVCVAFKLRGAAFAYELWIALQLFACSLHLQPATIVVRLSNCAENFFFNTSLRKNARDKKNVLKYGFPQRISADFADLNSENDNVSPFESYAADIEPYQTNNAPSWTHEISTKQHCLRSFDRSFAFFPFFSMFVVVSFLCECNCWRFSCDGGDGDDETYSMRSLYISLNEYVQFIHAYLFMHNIAQWKKSRSQAQLMVASVSAHSPLRLFIACATMHHDSRPKYSSKMEVKTCTRSHIGLLLHISLKRGRNQPPVSGRV